MIEARRCFPSAPEPFLDLSTGINPHPYPLAPIDPARLARLPEPEELSRLQAVAARAYGVVDPDMVVATPGTQIAISLLPHLLGCSRAVILSPTYAEHAAAWSHAGRPVEAAAGLEAFERGAMLPGTAAVLCNPNNPDGARSDRVRLLALAAGLARQGGVLICDEAFLDLEPDMVEPRHQRCRIPGCWCCARSARPTGWPGSGSASCWPRPASRGGCAAPSAPGRSAASPSRPVAPRWRDEAWRADMAERLLRDGAELDRLLLRYGWRCRGGTALFRLYEVRQATRLYAHLGAAGVLVRRFEHQPDLLRLGLPGDSGGWARLEGALATATLS